MKSSTKTVMLVCLLVLVFLSGFGFIYWMGNENNQPTEHSPKSLNDQDQDQDPNPDTEIGTETSDMCPTLLIKRGNQLMLFNKNMPETAGENPIFFNSLDQYVNYIKMQRELYGQTCPVLFLQEEVNAQGENVYRMRKTHDGAENIDPLLLGSMENYFQGAINVAPDFQPPRYPDAFNKPASNSSISLALYGTPIQNMPPQSPPVEVPYVDSNRSNPEYNQGYYGFDPSNQYVGRYTVLDKIHDSTKTQNSDGLSNNAMDPNWGGVAFTHQKIKEGEYDENRVEPPTNARVLELDA